MIESTEAVNGVSRYYRPRLRRLSEDSDRVVFEDELKGLRTLYAYQRRDRNQSSEARPQAVQNYQYEVSTEQTTQRQEETTKKAVEEVSFSNNREYFGGDDDDDGASLTFQRRGRQSDNIVFEDMMHRPPHDRYQNMPHKGWNQPSRMTAMFGGGDDDGWIHGGTAPAWGTDSPQAGRPQRQRPSGGVRPQRPPGRPQRPAARPQGPPGGPTTNPPPTTAATIPPGCHCPVTSEYNPVCGSDYITYTNPARLRCAGMCTRSSIGLIYYGNCRLKATQAPIIHPG